MDLYRKIMKRQNMQEIPWGKETLGALDTPLNELEKKALQNLDVDRLNDMAECLFALNNRHYGPIPGTYMVMVIEPGKKWCVGQLSADRAKPFILFTLRKAIHHHRDLIHRHHDRFMTHHNHHHHHSSS